MKQKIAEKVKYLELLNKLDMYLKKNILFYKKELVKILLFLLHALKIYGTRYKKNEYMVN